MTAPNVEAAIHDIEAYRRTHIEWAEHFERYPEVATEKIASGEWDDANEHRRIVACYDRVLVILHAAAAGAK